MRCSRQKSKWLANVATGSDATRMAAGTEFLATAPETATASSTVVVLRGTSVRATADLKCRLLDTDETSTQVRSEGNNVY